VTYRTAAGGQYSCPRCLRSLTTYRAGAFVVDACLACGGLFIDQAATRELTRAFDRDLVGLATTIGIGKGEAVGPGVYQKDLACPHCSGPLRSLPLPSASAEVDLCAEHGTWFDANELPKVARAYRRSREGAPTDLAAQELATILTNKYG
jgi:Zn-finger nucleic acid-binding protein